MPRKLKQLTVTAVSLVPRGSNPGAHIAFYKSHAQESPVEIVLDGRKLGEIVAESMAKATFNDLLVAEQRQRALWKIADSIYTMQEAMYSAIYATNPAGDIRKSVDQFGAYVNKLLDALESNTLDGDPLVAKQLVLKKAQDVFVRYFNQEPTTMSKSAVTPPATTGAETVQEVQLAELPPAVQKMIADSAEAVRKANEAADAAKKTAEEAMAKVDIEREMRETIEYTAKASAELTHLPGTPDEKGKILRALAKGLDPEMFEKAFALLKSGAAAMQQQTQAAGIERGASGEMSDLTAFFDAEAEKIRAANPKLHRSQAITKAYELHPAKYKELAKEEELNGRRGARVYTRDARH
jgi:hypothetical protein